MSRSTIDFGIDLGTTNSAIAVLNGVTTDILKNNTDADITPSAVSIDKRGNVQVGLRARNRLIDNSEDAYVEFKRLMGTDHSFHFKSSRQTRKPEELSAEVIKSLRADVEQRLGENVEASVVTVPAAFELHQCDATQKAAQAAGLKLSPLLQEPVAAALAYGFQAEEQKAYWLVYDFGGGTFDAAIIKAEEGTIHVVNHGGDNFLGGSNLDWAVVEQLLAPRAATEFGLKNFTRGNAEWLQAFAKLKRAAEIAKIDLSRGGRSTLETVTFPTRSSGQIEFECELTSGDLVRVAEPIIRQSIAICKRVLKEKNLGPSAFEKVLLVGGPTLALYFREILTESLGIPLDHSVDALTVVARGAAVFAGTQPYDARASVPQTAGEYTVELKHKPVGLDSAPMAGGKVSGAGTANFTGFTLELVNAKTQWRSGKIALRADGVFIANLHAERGERNVYAIELFDAIGRKRKTRPETLTYTIGAVIEGQPLINSMGIALANNEYAKFFEKGSTLPLKKTHDFRTAFPLRQSQSGEVLHVPVIEGENEKADRNRRVGELVVRPQNIRRDLPLGSEIEITMRVDENRRVTAVAYIPLLDEEISDTIDMSRQSPDAGFLQNDFENEMKRLRDVEAKAAAADDGDRDKAHPNVDPAPLAREVQAAISAAQGDAAAAAQAEKQLLELKRKLDEAANALEWPSLVVEARAWLSDLIALIAQHGSDAQKERAVKLETESNESIASEDADRLRGKLEHVKRLYFEVLFAQPGFWVHEFQQIENQNQRMSDPTRGTRLLDQGRECIAKNNAPGLQSIVRQLWDLLPASVVEAAQRGYQSGVTR